MPFVSCPTSRLSARNPTVALRATRAASRRSVVAVRASSSSDKNDGDDSLPSSSHPVSADDLGDWRAFRAALVSAERGTGSPPTVGALCEPARAAARWAHCVSAPEKGCLLLAARPDLGPLFTQAVVLIVDHDDAAGSAGLVLNAPSRGLIGDVGLDASLAGSFSTQPLYCGGPVAQNSLHLLHGAPGLEGAHEVIGGVYAGGLPSANSLVASGGAPAGSFRLLSGYAGWEPGQLAAEAERGAWHVVAASTAVVLDAVQGRLRDAHGAREKVGTWASIMALAGIELGSQLGSYNDGSNGNLGGGNGGGGGGSTDKKRRGRAQGPSAFD